MHRATSVRTVHVGAVSSGVPWGFPGAPGAEPEDVPVFDPDGSGARRSRPEDLAPARIGGVELPGVVAHRVRTARELLRSRDAVFRQERFSTGMPALDARLAGGIERGTLIEWHGSASGGRFSLLLSLLAAASAAGEAVALVDLGDGLDPETLRQAGGDLRRLLWLRPRTLREALASAEIAIGGGFPLVALDLGPPPIAGPLRDDPAWMRLQRAAERHRAALVVSTPFRSSGPASSIVLRFTARRRWSPRSQAVGAAGPSPAPALLFGLEAAVHVDKERGSTGGMPVQCALRTAATALYATDPGAGRPPGARPRRAAAAGSA